MTGTSIEARKAREEYLMRCDSDEPYTTEFLGKTLHVFPGVFSPAHYADTAFFAEALPYPSGAFLEVGCGTGAVSLAAAWNGARRVTATDINPAAVKNARLNALHHGLDDVITAYESDVYSDVAGDAEFDAVFWNTPWGYVDEDVSTELRGIWDPWYDATERYIEDGQDYLRDGGKLYVGFSPDIGDADRLATLLQRYEYVYDVIAEKQGSEDDYGDERCVLVEVTPRRDT